MAEQVAVGEVSHDIRVLVRADLWRCTGRKGWRAFFAAWFTDPAFRPVFTMRVCQFCDQLPRIYRAPALVIGRWWHQRARLRCAVDISWSMKVGPGLKLLHGVGTVINGGAIIGTNVTVMQGVTIGATSHGTPIIEDDVVVCANATVLGGVRLGRGAVVGAGAVVVKDVPPQCNVVGNPSRIVPRTSPPTLYFPLPSELR